MLHPLPSGLAVRRFPGFGATDPATPQAEPLPLGDRGRARSAATFGCSLVAGFMLSACAVLATPSHCCGAPRSARVERDARRRAAALELRDALREDEERPRDRHDGAR